MLTLFDDTALFQSGKLRIQEFDLPDAELKLYEHFFPREDADRIYTTLLADTPWKQEPITIHGQTVLNPRLTAWYGKRCSDGPELSLTSTLEYIKEKVEAAIPIQFTSVLLNLYRTGQDSVSWHRDRDRDNHPQPVVASVSFGETRPFQIRHKFRKELDKLEIPLNHGSLLVMAGPMQHYWEHQIPKTTKEIKPRINLTFRIVPE